MAKYGDWTDEEDETLLDIVGGTSIARAVLRGERKLIAGPGPTVEDIISQIPSSLPPLVGTLINTLRLKPNKLKSVAEAIKLGEYNGHDGEIVTLFADDEVRLTKAVRVDLIQYDHNPSYDEILIWAKANGERKPIFPKHIYATGIQHREEQRRAPIVGLGSVQRGNVLYLNGNSDWRNLNHNSVQSNWNRNCLFGFLS